MCFYAIESLKSFPKIKLATFQRYSDVNKMYVIWAGRSKNLCKLSLFVMLLIGELMKLIAFLLLFSY